MNAVPSLFILRTSDFASGIDVGVWNEQLKMAQ